MARLARQQADACSDDQAREAFLRKAEQTERTAAIEEWILFTGLAAAKLTHQSRHLRNKRSR